MPSITIPNSVTTIESSSFLGCNILSSVVFGSGLTSIAINAFSGTSLRKAVWLANTPPAGYNYTSLLPSITCQMTTYSIIRHCEIPVAQFLFRCRRSEICAYQSVRKDMRYHRLYLNDPEYTFSSTRFKRPVRYKGVTMDAVTIHPYLFYNNKYIKRVEAYSKADVPMYGYAGCSNIKTVIFHDFVMMINPHAFSGCSSLESIVFGTHLSTIGEEAFSDCTAVTEITTKNTTPPLL